MDGLQTIETLMHTLLKRPTKANISWHYIEPNGLTETRRPYCSEAISWALDSLGAKLHVMMLELTLGRRQMPLPEMARLCQRNGFHPPMPPILQ